MPAVGSKRTVALLDAYTQAQADAKFAALGEANDFTLMPSVGGDPVVESGSNTDGEWTRWADGTQICTFESASGTTSSSTGSVYYFTDSLTKMFPQAFTATPRVSCSTERTASGVGTPLSAALQDTPSNTSVGTVFVYGAANTSEGKATITATGRWK